MLRGSAADPLNLLQIMLAKGTLQVLPPAFIRRSASEEYAMIASKSSIEPQSGEPLPNSTRVYVPGKMHPDVRVPFREIGLSPTKSFNGQVEANAPVRVYDCSGPWGDPDFAGNVEQGLPALRAKWILARGDVEPVQASYKPIPGHSDRDHPDLAQAAAAARQARPAVTQLHYARQGIITPEMEFIAIRENLGREQHASRSTLHAPRPLGGQSFGAAIPAHITPEFVRAEVARGPRHHPGQHQPPGERADDHRAQLPGEDQRQHRQQRRGLQHRGGSREDALGQPSGARTR